jgi:hypothetical protein
MMNRIDNIITKVENGLFAVLGNGPVKRASPASTVRKAVRRPAKKVRKKK